MGYLIVRRSLDHLKEITRRSYEENYGRDNIAAAIESFRERLAVERDLVVLDIGAGPGSDLTVANSVLNGKVALNAVELDRDAQRKLEAKGIQTHAADIERQSLPFGDSTVDIVIANQVIEHTKEIFWIFNEIQRVLSPTGIAIIGVPNIASLHNRVGLAFGRQPTQIAVLSAHVRGFTAASFREFVEVGGCFELVNTAGANFYPFPARLARRLAALFPKAAWGLTFTVRKTRSQNRFIDVLQSMDFETPYFSGEGVGKELSTS